jgi:hypothetical protein
MPFNHAQSESALVNALGKGHLPRLARYLHEGIVFSSLFGVPHEKNPRSFLDRLGFGFRERFGSSASSCST